MSIKCSECGNFLKEEINKCPNCRSMKRTIKIIMKDTIGISESLGLKKKSAESSKTYTKQTKPKYPKPRNSNQSMKHQTYEPK